MLALSGLWGKMFKNVTNQGNGAYSLRHSRKGTGIYLWVEMLNLSPVPNTPNQLNKILFSP
jgi:hypothetical protein